MIAPQPVPVSATGWTFSFSPYFWAVGLRGKSQVFGLPTVDVSQDFGDILSDLDFAFMAPAMPATTATAFSRI